MSLDEGGLYTCDIICWGTPSPEAFASYIHWLGAKYDTEVVKYCHRMKSLQWKGARPVALFANGEKRWGQDVRLWQEIWYGKLCRPSCYACGYHSTSRPSNVTIGDYWGLEESHPGLTRGDGVSSLIVNDAKGSELVLACNHDLDLVPSTMELCANKRQPMLRHAPKPDPDRDKFWRAYRLGGFQRATRVLYPLSIAKANVRRFTTQLRGLFGGSYSHKSSNGSHNDSRWKKAIVIKADGLLSMPYPHVYAARHRSKDVRLGSSSGGVFSALAQAIIDRGGVVYGCAYNQELVAVHIRCETLEEVERCRGSKYSQSRMGQTIADVKNDLTTGRPVLFTGTPCQVAAVRRCCENMGADHS